MLEHRALALDVDVMTRFQLPTQPCQHSASVCMMMMIQKLVFHTSTYRVNVTISPSQPPTHQNIPITQLELAVEQYGAVQSSVVWGEMVNWHSSVRWNGVSMYQSYYLTNQVSNWSSSDDLVFNKYHAYNPMWCVYDRGIWHGETICPQ